MKRKRKPHSKKTKAKMSKTAKARLVGKHPGNYKGDNAMHNNLLTKGEYKTLLEKQNSLCAICGKEETRKARHSDKVCRLHVDHNHETGKVRGLLCHKCNFGVANFMDNVEFLLNAIKYLKEEEQCQSRDVQ